MQDAILVFCRQMQHSALIARILRYREYRCLPVAFDTTAQHALSMKPRGIIIAGNGPDALEGLDFSLLNLDLPVLALDDAAAMLCTHFGGSAVETAGSGSFQTLRLERCALFDEISSGERMISRLQALTLSDVLSPIASAADQIIGFAHSAMPLYGMQYPIERNDPDGAQMLANFAALCGM